MGAAVQCKKINTCSLRLAESTAEIPADCVSGRRHDPKLLELGRKRDCTCAARSEPKLWRSASSSTIVEVSKLPQRISSFNPYHMLKSR